MIKFKITKPSSRKKNYTLTIDNSKSNVPLEYANRVVVSVIGDGITRNGAKILSTKKSPEPYLAEIRKKIYSPANVIEGGIGANRTIDDLAKKYNVRPIHYKKIYAAIDAGIGVEKEHSPELEKMKEIAFDHLWETGMLYYQELSKMEKKLERNPVKFEKGAEVGDDNDRMRMLALKAKADADALALLELEMEMGSGETKVESKEESKLQKFINDVTFDQLFKNEVEIPSEFFDAYEEFVATGKFTYNDDVADYFIQKFNLENNPEKVKTVVYWVSQNIKKREAKAYFDKMISEGWNVLSNDELEKLSKSKAKITIDKDIKGIKYFNVVEGSDGNYVLVHSKSKKSGYSPYSSNPLYPTLYKLYSESIETKPVEIEPEVKYGEKTTMYYKIKTESLDKYLNFLKGLKEHSNSVKVFSAGIGVEYLIVTGIYDKNAAMHPDISIDDFDDYISRSSMGSSKNIISFKRLNSKPTPENSYNGKWNDIDDRIKHIQEVLSEEEEVVEANVHPETAPQKEAWEMTKSEIKANYKNKRAKIKWDEFQHNALENILILHKRKNEITKENSRMSETLWNQIINAGIIYKDAGKWNLSEDVIEYDKAANMMIDHEYFIKQALLEGKPVPAEVLADYPELQNNEPVESVKMGKRNVWIPKMSKNSLERLLAKDVSKLTEDEKEDLLDFKYFLLFHKKDAFEKGLMDVYASDNGAIYVPKNKFWVTNIDNATKGFESKFFIENKEKLEAGGFIKCPTGTQVQSVLMSKDVFSRKEAVKWVKEHDYSSEIDETENYYRFRQQEPEQFEEESFRTIEFTDGIKAVVGCPVEKMEDGKKVGGKKILCENQNNKYSIDDWENNSLEIIRKNPNGCIVLYHGSINEIYVHDKTPLYFTPSIISANDYILARGDFKSGEYGYIYSVVIPLKNLKVVDDIDSLERFSQPILSPIENGYIRIDNPSAYELKIVSDNQIKQKLNIDYIEILDNYSCCVNNDIVLECGGAIIPETIVVDGVERPTRNSDGNYIYSTVSGIENFWRWFVDSKVVDEHGRPLVVYHGTNVSNISVFKESYDGGYWFTSKIEVANDFAVNNNIGGVINIYPVYLSIKNPYIKDLNGEFMQDSKELFDAVKYTFDTADGFIIKNALDQVESNVISDIFNCFNPTQIKSATGNNGNFDQNNPDIRFAEGGSVKYDRSGNPIGEGSWHIEPTIFDFSEYPQIKSSVDYSQSTESTYVTYRNTENDKKITVRFSQHESNAVKFGDQLNGYFATKDEVLYHLGLKKREFIPKTFLSIPNRQVAKKKLGNYEEADKTIQEMYALGANADISMYNGKIAKGSNYLIMGDTVEEIIDTRQGSFGNPVELGKYVYSDIDENNKKAESGMKINDGTILYRVTKNENLTKENIRLPFHAGTLEQAERIADIKDYGNDAVYYKIILDENARIYTTSDTVANILDKEIRKEITVSIGKNILNDCISVVMRNVKTNEIIPFINTNGEATPFVNLQDKDASDFLHLYENMDYDAIRYENEIEGDGYSYLILTDKFKIEKMSGTKAEKGMKIDTDTNGGAAYEGNLHTEGGIPATVKETGQEIEFEVGEIVINRVDAQKHCEELSKINSEHGKKIDCDCLRNSNKDENLKDPKMEGEIDETGMVKLEKGDLISDRMSKVNSLWRKMFDDMQENKIMVKVLDVKSEENADLFIDDFKNSDYANKFRVSKNPIYKNKVQVSLKAEHLMFEKGAEIDKNMEKTLSNESNIIQDTIENQEVEIEEMETATMFENGDKIGGKQRHYKFRDDSFFVVDWVEQDGKQVAVLVDKQPRNKWFSIGESSADQILEDAEKAGLSFDEMLKTLIQNGAFVNIHAEGAAISNEYPHPFVKAIDEQIIKAGKEYRAIEDAIYGLAGDRNKQKRQEVISAIVGDKVPAAKSGISAIEEELKKWILAKYPNANVTKRFEPILKEEAKADTTEKEAWEMTLDEYVEEKSKDIPEGSISDLRAEFHNEYYNAIQKHLESNGQISQRVYEQLEPIFQNRVVAKYRTPISGTEPKTETIPENIPIEVAKSKEYQEAYRKYEMGLISLDELKSFGKEQPQTAPETEHMEKVKTKTADIEWENILLSMIPNAQKKMMSVSEDFEVNKERLITQLKAMPKLYGQDGKKGDAIAYFHYFVGSLDIYLMEFSKSDDESSPYEFYTFGSAVEGGDFEGSYAYFPDWLSFTPKNIEFDYYFEPTPLRNIQDERNPYYEKEQEAPTVDKEMVNIRTKIYANAYEQNKGIEKFIELAGENTVFTGEDIEFMNRYTGYGGLGKFMDVETVQRTEAVGTLYEYYTPDELCKKLWGLAYKHGFDASQLVLEPSCGIGRIIKYAPNKSLVKAYETNPTSSFIAKATYRGSDIVNDYFESEFYMGFGKRTRNKDYAPAYGLVIGNYPFGDYSGKYASMGEKDYSKATQVDHHFIVRGLDALVSGGLMVCIVNSRFMQGGHDAVKAEIEKRGELIDAYRLPAGVFQNTEVIADILVIRKK